MIKTVPKKRGSFFYENEKLKKELKLLKLSKIKEKEDKM